VREVMASLPREMAECLYLYEVEGFKSPDLAKVLGISPEAVRQRVARARKRFREAYRALEGSGHGSR
ncbi:MAG: sigma factor-like helix-turn-helix DNA-binding protein, partial [Chloroflexota bacterium]|nr:sigma factor-like helix-turn-helix DNA-binding protein [Chloroflexota bacterium]